MHLTKLPDLGPELVARIVEDGERIKADPNAVRDAMQRKTLLMIFEKPSLRTRLSFEAGMTQMGGHAIFYSIKDSPLGKKESMADTAEVASRMVDAIMARLFEHKDLLELARHSRVPVINALTNHTHPCQALADLMTIREKKGRIAGLKLAYFGDCFNNVTHSLLYAGALTGMHVTVACPQGKQYEPDPAVLDEACHLAARSGAALQVTHDPAEAAKKADVVYTDSWMSYHIPKEKEPERVAIFGHYQVNAAVMARAKRDAIFMNCLPAIRGMEQTAEVIDGPQSVVFDQAENRLHVQKALLVALIGSKVAS
ncbi:MAG: ornithine carbamoyltransferase [Planctomycetota bacterium]